MSPSYEHGRPVNAPELDKRPAQLLTNCSQQPLHRWFCRRTAGYGLRGSRGKAQATFPATTLGDIPQVADEDGGSSAGETDDREFHGEAGPACVQGLHLDPVSENCGLARGKVVAQSLLVPGPELGGDEDVT